MVYLHLKLSRMIVAQNARELVLVDLVPTIRMIWLNDLSKQWLIGQELCFFMQWFIGLRLLIFSCRLLHFNTQAASGMFCQILWLNCLLLSTYHTLLYKTMHTFSVYMSGDVQHLFLIHVRRMGKNSQSGCLIWDWVALWDILRSILLVSARFLTYKLVQSLSNIIWYMMTGLVQFQIWIPPHSHLPCDTALWHCLVALPCGSSFFQLAVSATSISRMP